MSGKTIENQYNSANLISLNRKYGAPFNLTLPIKDIDIKMLLTPEKMVPYSRWTLGRKKNPSFLLNGSGFEGHGCALTPDLMVDYLLFLEKNAHDLIKRQDGIKMLEKFLDNPDLPINLNFLKMMKEAFEITLSRARIVRAMTSTGKIKLGDKDIKLDPDRIERAGRYAFFIEKAPLVIDCYVKQGNGVLSLEQRAEEIEKIVSPIPTEPIGTADIGDDRRFPILAQIGRFGNPLVSLLVSHYNGPSFGKNEFYFIPNKKPITI